MSWIAVAGTAVAAGGAVYAANQQKKASKNAQSQLQKGTTFLEPTLLGAPAQIDPRKLNYEAIVGSAQMFPFAANLAGRVNQFQFNTAQKYYQKIQPFFKQLQSQIGENALSFARGQLPDDVASEIQRRAAEQGIQGGYGFGSQGGRSGALANLNLRNLGLASLDLSRFGTQLGMNVNQSARSLLPNMMSPAELFLSPSQYLGAEQFNVGAQNQFALQNNAIQNQANLQNTSLSNSLNQTMAGMDYNQALAQAQMVQQIGSSLGGALSANAGMLGSRPAPNPTVTDQGSFANARSVLNTYPRQLV